MRMRPAAHVCLAFLVFGAGAASAQTRGGAGGNAGSIQCVNCIVYGDMIAGSGGSGGDALGGRKDRRTRGTADRQTNVGPGSKCITYNGRPYCD